MPINNSPEDDAYHPCVDFYNENTEAELILPGIPLTWIVYVFLVKKRVYHFLQIIKNNAY